MPTPKKEFQGSYHSPDLFHFEIPQPTDQIVNASIDKGPKFWGTQKQTVFAKPHTVLGSVRTMVQILAETPKLHDKDLNAAVKEWSQVTAPPLIEELGKNQAGTHKRRGRRVSDRGIHAALTSLAKQSDPFVQIVSHLESWRRDSISPVSPIDQNIGHSAMELFLLVTRGDAVDAILRS